LNAGKISECYLKMKRDNKYRAGNLIIPAGTLLLGEFVNFQQTTIRLAYRRGRWTALLSEQPPRIVSSGEAPRGPAVGRNRLGSPSADYLVASARMEE
jgi:hypothetical protein